MKKIILTAVLSAATLGAFAQGTIDIGNFSKGTFVAPIFSPNPASPGVQQVGNPGTTSYQNGGTPLGTTVYGGVPLQAGYDMVFLYSTSSTVPSQMSVGTTVPFQTAATATARPAGTMVSLGAFVVPGVPGNSTINWCFGAFSTEGGTVTTWAQALAAFASGDPNSQIGSGTVVTGTLLGGGANPAEPTTYGGWTSFSLVTPAPEPSTIALAGLGAAGLLLFRRRK